MSGGLALGMLLAHLALVFGLQEITQRRRTGRSSWVAPARKERTERLADGLFVLATLLAVGAPALVIADVLEPAYDVPAPRAVGAALIVLATVGAKWAQHEMGAAWRTGVADEASDVLVETGAFAWVRNPVYTALLAAAAGAALLAPTAAAALAVVVFVMALEIQTRAVEEPHLRRVHGARYASYAARVGRFVPLVGRVGAAGGHAEHPEGGRAGARG